MEEWEKYMLERYVLLEVTLCLPLLLLPRMKWLPKTFNTTTREAHRDVCYRTKTSGEDTIDAPLLWKCRGTREDDVSWRSQGAHGIPHRDISSLPNLRGRQLVLVTSWKFTRRYILKAQPSLKTHSFHFIHPKQYGAFPRRIVLPFPDSEILPGHEEDVSSIRDEFTAWVKSDNETSLKRHVVDSKCIYPAYREAPARKHSPFVLWLSLPLQHAKSFT